jgi:hypothetical protein
MEYKVNDYVKFVANNEWNGLIGIISEIHKGILHIVCIHKPAFIYFVDESNMGDIEPFVID